MAITVSGQEVLAFLTRELDELQAVRFRLRCLQNADGERLSIGILSDLSTEVEYSHAIGFEEETGGRVHVSLERYTPYPLVARLLNGRIDAILTGLSLLTGQVALSYATFSEAIPFVLIVSDKNPYARPEAAVTDFAAFPLIVEQFREETTDEFRTRAEELARRCGLKPATILPAPNRESAYMGVRMERGVLLCTMADKFVHAPETIVYDTGFRETLVFAWRKDDGSPLVAKYLDYLQRAWQQETQQMRWYSSYMRRSSDGGENI